MLLVDDDYDTREAFTVLAETAGLDAVVAFNGREALDQLRAGLRPCAIVLDWAMPEMNGAEFRQAQIADPSLADIAVAVTSGAAWAIEREAKQLGLTTFLPKPIDPDRMLTVFGTLCHDR